MSEATERDTTERAPCVVHLTIMDLRLHTTWDEMKTLMISRGVPPERLEGKPDFRSEDRGEDGLILEFP